MHAVVLHLENTYVVADVNTAELCEYLGEKLRRLICFDHDWGVDRSLEAQNIECS